MNEVTEYREPKMTNETAPVFVNLENQMSAINALGEAIMKSGFAGCERIEQGVIVAFTCLAERITPMEFARQYDIIQGKPTKKAAVMLAEFRSKYKGDFEWIEDGEDKKIATIKLTFKGKVKPPVSFTVEEAKSKGLANKANWKMHLPEMLRARASTKALRMHCPEIAAGIYDPSELDDVIDYPNEHSTVGDLEFALENISEDLRAEATRLILKRFKVTEINKLSPDQATLVMEHFDTFIESLSTDGASREA